jgi:hypothetical protein
MRRRIASSFCGVLLFATFALAQAPSSAPATKPAGTPAAFSLAISPVKAEVQVGEPKLITLVGTNLLSVNLLWLVDKGSDPICRDYHFLLLKDGHEVETTKLHRRLTGRTRPGDGEPVLMRSSFGVLQPPGKMFEYTVDLNDLYTITEPGIYTAVISRYDDASKSTVRSNEVTFAVVKRKLPTNQHF